MSRSVAVSILRAALLASAAFGLAGSGAALARVGVTSATDGDPLGKPPQESERVLRIGIDVQANEVIRTGANDRAHLVFLDGTSLTVGPNAQLTIDKFVYDPNTKVGELAVSATQGVLRLVGGKISKSNAITISTPSSTIGIRGGICMLDVRQLRTISTFLFGNQMTVSGGGHRQEVTRPGSQVTTTSGAAPGAPTLVGSGALAAQLAQLEGTAGGGGNNAGGGGGTASNGGNADRGAQNFGRGNSGQGPGAGGPGPVTGGSPQNQGNNILASNGGANPNGGANGAAPRTTIVLTQGSITTAGRYLADPTFTGFNPSTLGATTVAANDKTIDGSGTVKTATVTTTSSSGTSTASASSITLTVPGSGAGSGTIALPWMAGTLSSGFSIGTISALGMTLTDGMGYVSPNGEFFAYVFNVNGNKVGLFGGTPTTTSGTANFPTSGVAAFSIAAIGDSTKIPFAVNTIKNDTNLSSAAVVSNLYTSYSTSLSQPVGQAPPDARATALQSTISISGTGANQKSYMGVFIGTFYRDITTTGGVVTTDNGVALSGSYSGTYRTGATGAIGTSTSAESTPLTGTGNAIYGTPGKDGAASGIILTPDKLTSTASISGGLVTDVTTTRTTQGSYDTPSANVTGSGYYTVTAAAATATPSGIGTSRTTQTLNGFVGGVVEQVDSSGANLTTRTIATSDPTALVLNTNATNNRASADITVANWGTTGGSSPVAATFHLGGTTGGNDASGAFIDDNTYAVRDRTAAVGGTTTVAGSSSTVTSSTTLVSYATAPTPTLFSNAGVTPCTCSFLTWGWWGGNVNYSNTSGYSPGSADRMNFATYVAGTLSTASTINGLSSSATYNGHMVGNVVNGANSYIQAGSYQNVWSFGSQNGVVTASFDGTSFGGGVTANTIKTGDVTFGTNGGIVAGGKTLTLNGAFFSSASNGSNAAGQAGSFAITGSAYKAAGTFAAQK